MSQHLPYFTPPAQVLPPPPIPGQVVSVTFDLWPQYLKQHDLAVVRVWWDERQGQLYAQIQSATAKQGE